MTGRRLLRRLRDPWALPGLLLAAFSVGGTVGLALAPRVDALAARTAWQLGVPCRLEQRTAPRQLVVEDGPR